jgi:acylphosphatase
MSRYFIMISGIVQGVGFRYFTYYTAKNLGLTGWVRNCTEGNVELEVQGSEENILMFVDRIKNGNGYSFIDNIFSNKIDIIKDEKSFKITV